MNKQPPASHNVHVFEQLSTLQQWRNNATTPVTLVPTMGALHEGHLSLVREALNETGRTIVSIFVNPLQFGAGEDLDRYPRTIQEDLDLLGAEAERAGQEIAVYIPPVTVMYPDGAESDRQTRVHAGAIGNVFEGLARPGHFDGMLTVVLKLFHQITPERAIFGKKDAQQLFLIRKMVQDFNLDVEIIGAPIIRESDGLALSSRNRYLSEEARQTGLLLSQSLAAVRDNSGRGVQRALEAGIDVLASTSQIKIDYLAAVYPDTFNPLPEGYTGPAIALVAATVGGTRLIDNLDIDF